MYLQKIWRIEKGACTIEYVLTDGPYAQSTFACFYQNLKYMLVVSQLKCEN